MTMNEERGPKPRPDSAGAYPAGVTTSRAILLLVVLAIVSASLLAFESRAPEAVRKAEPGPDATDPSNGASFTDTEVARHGAYRGSAYISIALSVFLEVVAL